jgi:chromosomal replication initiator protein
MEELIKDLLGFSARPKVGVEQIKSIVATHFGLSPDDLEGASRKKNLVYPRMLAMYFARKNTKLSLSEIGQAFGGRDHSTVIHANNKIIDLIESDPHVQRDVVNIEKILG